MKLTKIFVIVFLLINSKQETGINCSLLNSHYFSSFSKPVIGTDSCTMDPARGLLFRMYSMSTCWVTEWLVEWLIIIYEYKEAIRFVYIFYKYETIWTTLFCRFVCLREHHMFPNSGDHKTWDKINYGALTEWNSIQQ